MGAEDGVRDPRIDPRSGRPGDGQPVSGAGNGRPTAIVTTMRDIATAARVSQSTVSRVLNADRKSVV